MKLKVSDQVIVTTGKYKGTKSTVTAVFPKKSAVLVSGVNIVTKHRKPMSGQAGEILKFEKPVHVGKVAILNEKGQADRVKYSVSADGKKVRVFAKTGTTIPDVAPQKNQK